MEACFPSPEVQIREAGDERRRCGGVWVGIMLVVLLYVTVVVWILHPCSLLALEVKSSSGS